MPWILEHAGEKYAVQNGHSHTITERENLYNGGYLITETKHYQNGYKEIRTKETPALTWRDENQSLPNAACQFTSSVVDQEDELVSAAWRTGARARQQHEENLDNPGLVGDLLRPEETLLEAKGLIKMKKPKYRTGLRVEFRCPKTNECHIGTVVTPEREHALPTGQFLICADFQNGYFRALDKYTGKGYGVIVKAPHIHPLSDQSRLETFAGVPDHIGVMVHTPFEWDGVRFKVGRLGRLLYFEGSQAIVSWFNIRSHHFYEHANVVRPGHHRTVTYKQCYAVPADVLQWCRWDLDHEVMCSWRGSIQQQAGPKFKVNDYVVYTSSRPARVSGESSYAVAKGAILQIKSHDSRGVAYIAALVGNADDEGQMDGLQVRLDSSSLTALEFPYIEAGNKVEIVASLEFKKKELQGAKGLVILPTDADGDVGIQFHEDIGAGSLDGHGRNRHCLYVPAHALQKISE